MLQKYKRPVKFPCFVSHVQSATPPGYGFLGVLAWSIAPFDFVPKEKGLLRSEGKDYVMQEGDIVLFRFNV